MAVPVSVRTRAAASRALSFLDLGVRWALVSCGLALAAGALGDSDRAVLGLDAFAALSVVAWVLGDFVFMGVLLWAWKRWIGCHRQAAGTTRRDARQGVSACARPRRPV